MEIKNKYTVGTALFFAHGGQIYAAPVDSIRLRMSKDDTYIRYCFRIFTGENYEYVEKPEEEVSTTRADLPYDNQTGLAIPD